jgi:hypothetical protein
MSLLPVRAWSLSRHPGFFFFPSTSWLFSSSAFPFSVKHNRRGGYFWPKVGFLLAFSKLIIAALQEGVVVMLWAPRPEVFSEASWLPSVCGVVLRTWFVFWMRESIRDEWSLAKVLLSREILRHIFCLALPFINRVLLQVLFLAVSSEFEQERFSLFNFWKRAS